MSKQKLLSYWLPETPYKSAGKLDRFEIILNQNHGLLSDPKDDYATVTTFYTHKEVKPSGVAENKTRRRIVSGPAGEVYHYHLDRTEASRDLFQKAWNQAKDKNLSHLTAFPYKPAYINEKLNELISEKYYGGAKEFAEKSNKDYANIHKEVRGKRKISHKQAIEYAQVLNVDPVDLLFEKQKTKVWAAVNFLQNIGTSTDYTYRTGQLKFYGEEKFTTVPRDIYKPNIRCVKVESKGSMFDRHNLFYYKSHDKQPANCHGKLCMVGVNQVFDGVVDYQEYFVGIYEEQLGGKINLLNPDPLSSSKYILTDIQNIYAVAPIVAVVNPSLLRARELDDEIDYEKFAEVIAKEERDRLREQNKVVKQAKDNERFREQYLKLQEEMELKIKQLEKNLYKEQMEYWESKKRA